MVSAPEAEDLLNGDSEPTSGAREVSIDHLDYKYIDSCSDVKYMEKIVKVLRSGKEGMFPQLVQHAEKRLHKLDSKSKVLNVPVPITRRNTLDSRQQSDIDGDLDSFLSDMSTQQKSRVSNNSSALQNAAIHDGFPAVRGCNRSIGQKEKVGQSDSPNEDKKNRIKSGDYRSWDKFDVEAECERIEKQPVPPTPESVQPPTLPHDEVNLKPESLAEPEIIRRANIEKEKGNEAFKSGDYDEAIVYYTRSLRLNETAAAYNNRAMCNLKKKAYDTAVEDTSKVLQLEPGNLKATIRRGQAYFGLKDYMNGRNDANTVLTVEPENKAARKLMEDINRENPPPKPGAKRLTIEECSDDDDKDEEASDEAMCTNGNGSNGSSDSNNGWQNDKSSQAKSSEKDIWDSAEIGVAHDDKYYDCADDADQKLMDNSPSSPPVVKEVITSPAQRQIPNEILEHKGRANTLFYAGQYHEAMLEYSNAIDKMSMEDKSHFASALSVLWSNRAACQIKMGNLKQGVIDCENAFKCDETNAKALIRRAVCFQGLERYREAFVDFREAIRIKSTIFASIQDDYNAVKKALIDADGPNWQDYLPAFNTYGVVSYESITEKYNALKEEGNAFVKQLKFESASEKYTQCIATDPTRAVAYANRATCYNQRDMFESALKDCTTCIDILEKKPDDNLKGKVYYRRFIAKTAMQQFRAALDDLIVVRKMYPKVKQYEDDFAEAMHHYKMQKAEQGVAAASTEKAEDKVVPPKKVQILEVDSDSEDEDMEQDNVQEINDNPIVTPTAKVTEVNDKCLRSQLASKLSFESGNLDTNNAKQTEKLGGMKNVDVKVAVPGKMTGYEFTQAWQSLKANTGTSAYAALIDQIGGDLSSVISSKCDGEMFSKLIRVLHDEYSSRSQQCLSHLNSLTKIKRFQVCLMFLGPDEKNILSKLLQNMENHDSKQVRDLKKKYKVP